MRRSRKTSFHSALATLGCLVASFFLPSPAAGSSGRELVEKMVQAVGGTDRLYELRDVEHEYVYRDAQSGKQDVSLERYVFDGELSWARFLERGNAAFPDVEGELIQGYDGATSWVTLDGALVDDPQMAKVSDFLRKTNYYWFTMMFKLLDPGMTYELLEPQEVEGVAYRRLKVGFEENVGDVQDTYLIYLHPETHLVDRFLFTVLDFGLSDPHLMEVEYEEIEGLKLPTYRRYAPADWDGNVTEEKWTEEISRKVTFGNGFTREQFQAPD